MAKLNSQKLLEEKVYRRRRLYKRHENTVTAKLAVFGHKRDTFIVRSEITRIHQILNNVGFNDLSYIYSDIQVPKNFTFTEEFETSFKIIKNFVGAIANNITGNIELDFSKCTKIETAPIFIMQVIRFEIDEIMQAKIKHIKSSINKTVFTVVPSKHKNVNRMLLLCGLITKEEYDECLTNTNEDNSDQFEPIYRTGYYKGSKSQKHYFENKKSIITTEIVTYINNCLNKHDSSLNQLGQNSLEGILSEILNNAEDHGVLNNWYVTANFSKEITINETSDNLVGEMNLSILNFGQSIYEGLLDSRADNYENFSELVKTKSNLETQFEKHGYTEENLFTLYALQDGISRLKYQDDSRGTGTIKFLNSFLILGDFEDKTKNYIPRLSIFSGHTLLICDNNYKPFDNSGVYLLTLNPEKDLKYPPKNTNLKRLENNFPGTLLNVNIYLSKAHLDTKVETSEYANPSGTL